MDNHGSDYNFVNDRIYHVSDDDAGGTLTYDAYFQTDINGVVTKGPYDLFDPGDDSEDPEGLAVDPFTGRIWVSLHGNELGIFEINPDDGTILNYIDATPAQALAFNPVTGKLFLDRSSEIWEIATDGTGLEMVFNPGTGIAGMAFTPTGDLVLSAADKLLLYDSDCDADSVFTTAVVPGGLAQNLIGYWKFDGDGMDSSGGGRDLGLYGGVGFTAGLFGQALDLNGDGTQYAQRPGDDEIYDFGDSDFTIQVWVKLNHTDSEQVLIEKFSDSNGPGWTLTYYDRHSSFNRDWHFYALPSMRLYTLKEDLDLGQWHQVIVRKSGTGIDDIDVFCDNNITEYDFPHSYVVPPGTIPDTTYPLLVGKRNPDDGRGFPLDGLIDEVAIWNRALSDSEIALLWNGGNGYELTFRHCVSTALELHDALAEAENNAADDIIQIMQGTYIGNFVYESSEQYGVTMEGGYTEDCNDRVAKPASTVLDGNFSGPVLVLDAPAAAADFVVDGLTIQNGIATGMHGGGIFANTSGGTVLIVKSKIADNSAGIYGGGIFIDNAHSATLVNNEIVSNLAEYHGGGIFIQSVSHEVNISNNEIIGNFSNYSGGGIHIRPDNITLHTINIENNLVENNTSTDDGGGIYIYGTYDEIYLKNNIVKRNETKKLGGGIIIAPLSGEVHLVNNLIIKNICIDPAGEGGGVMIYEAFNKLVNLINNTIVENTSPRGGGIYIEINDANIYNNIMYNNNAIDASDVYINNENGFGPAVIDLFNNDFNQTQPSGTYIQIPFPIHFSNLVNEDPLFVDPTNDDYHLGPGSPCIDAGVDPVVPALPSEDFEGDDRVVGPRPDIGADEYVPAYIQIVIDIKPGGYPNSINLKSKGVIPVAVLTTDDFDAYDIDPDSCIFADAEPEKWTMEDVDGDGDWDILFHFRTQELSLNENSEEATLIGSCEDGTPIEGTDSIVIVPKPRKGQLHPMKYELVVTYYTDEEEGDWIELELKDRKGNPVAGDYVLVLPDGDTRTGSTDENGFAREDNVEPGTATVEFPDLRFRTDFGISPL
jgi:parallel beta-helix repeat protein